MIIDAEIENLQQTGRRDPARHRHRQALHHPAAARRDGLSTPSSSAPARDRPNSWASPAKPSTASSRPTNSSPASTSCAATSSRSTIRPWAWASAWPWWAPGNTAMDSARVALRMGAESVTVVYRRSRRESPARAEELEHAIEEGVEFRWLTNPVEILGTRLDGLPGCAASRWNWASPTPPAAAVRCRTRLRIRHRRGHRDLCPGHHGQPHHRPDHPGLEDQSSGATSKSTRRTGMTSLPGRLRRRRHRHRRRHRDPGHGRRTARRPRHAGIYGNPGNRGARRPKK